MAATAAGVKAGPAARLLMMVRSVSAARELYVKTLKLQEVPVPAPSGGSGSSDKLLLSAGNGLQLLLQETYKEAELSGGYNTILQLEVGESVEALVPECLMRHGCHMDGRIEYSPLYTAAGLRTPDGHMLSLLQRNSSSVGAGAGAGAGTMR